MFFDASTGLSVIVGSGIIAASFSVCAPSAAGITARPNGSCGHTHAVGPDATASGTRQRVEHSQTCSLVPRAPPNGPGAEFLVLTGDFGIGRCLRRHLPLHQHPDSYCRYFAPSRLRHRACGQRAIAQIERCSSVRRPMCSCTLCRYGRAQPALMSRCAGAAQRSWRGF